MGISSRIKKLHEEYFSIFLETLGDDIELASKMSDLEVMEFAIKKKSESSIIYPYRGVELSSFEYKLLSFTQEITAFWKRNADWLRKDVGSLTGSRLQLPYTQYPETVASDTKKLSTYFDTVVVVDDPVRYDDLFDVGIELSRRELIINFRKAAVMYRLREIALLDVEPPIVVILPPTESVDKKLVNEYTLGFINEIFPGRFDNSKPPIRLCLEVNEKNASELLELAKTSKLFSATVEDIDITPLSRALWDVNTGSVKNYTGYLKDLPEHMFVSGFLSTVVMWFDTYCRQQSQAIMYGNDLVVGRRMWEIHKWYLESNARKSFSGYGLSQSELAAMVVMSPEMDFLGNLSTEELLSLRGVAGLEEIRKSINTERSVLKTLNIEEFASEADKAAFRLLEAIKEYEKELQQRVVENRKRMRRGFSSLGLAAILGVASIAVPLVAIPATLVALFAGTESIRGVINRHITGKRVVNEMNQRAIAILYHSYQKHT